MGSKKSGGGLIDLIVGTLVDAAKAPVKAALGHVKVSPEMVKAEQARIDKAKAKKQAKEDRKDMSMYP